MNRITNVKRRRRAHSYESPLRNEQSDATRRRILDALVRTMGNGVAGLSVPAVAREAGVSVPTVYRHFKTKAELVAALAPYLASKTRLMDPPDVPDQDFGAIVREMYRRNEALDSETRAAMASQLGQQLRRRTMPDRLALIRRAVAARVPRLSAEELERFTRIVMILNASATMRAYNDYLGMNASQAADDVTWAINALQRAHQRGRR